MVSMVKLPSASMAKWRATSAAIAACPVGEVEAQPATRHAAGHEAGADQGAMPLRLAVVADMRGVAQQLDRLQEAVADRRFGRDDVDEDGASRRLEHPARLGQRGGKAVPVMGAEAAQHEIERGGGEGKALGRPLPRDDIAEPARRRRSGDCGQHVGGEVVGNDPGDRGRDGEGDVPGAAAKVEQARRRGAGDDRGQLLQVLAGGMDRAGQVVGGAGAELAGHQLLVRLAHGALP